MENNRNRRRAGRLVADAREQHRFGRSYGGREHGRGRRAEEPAGPLQPGPKQPPWTGSGEKKAEMMKLSQNMNTVKKIVSNP